MDDEVTLQHHSYTAGHLDGHDDKRHHRVLQPQCYHAQQSLTQHMYYHTRDTGYTTERGGLIIQ